MQAVVPIQSGKIINPPSCIAVFELTVENIEYTKSEEKPRFLSVTG